MKKSKRLWVIDWGEALIKIVLGEVNDSGSVRIIDFRIEKNPKLIWPETNPETKRATSKLFRSLFKGYHRRDEVMLLINQAEMMVATFTFPMMSLSDLEDAIYWQMQLLTSEDLDHWRIDFVARVQNQWFECLGMDEQTLDVVGVAIKKAQLTRYIRFFKKNGRSLNAIVPQFYPLDSLLIERDGQSTLIIDIGSRSTRFFHYKGNVLSENHQIELESGWDGAFYLQQIIKVVEQIFISPLGCEKVGQDGTIYLMGGESLHPGVREYLSKSMGKDVQSIDVLLEANESLVFAEQISRVQLCLVAPCVCGLMKYAQTRGGKN
ncbi:MAG: hypothetical protein BI182_05605 [Acetobacterium sp. MES1]|uniref:type IV pilus biogenesis protein PilM n=1 Tax=Acetobacterium sp. MES1 TaxID=1899015 RepID=UPI000B9CBE95|nr:hypothetical protein [Acetobacterium sp. MES1]OXS25209.1 MAG: hypothetical protein BI182_05605 [Acetobacterium sp. MES1]